MNTSPRAVTWEAPEHHHLEKSGDWYWALGIITIASTLAAIFFGNILFALVLALSGGVVALMSARRPRVIPFAVTVRGLRVNDQLYPFATLESYAIDEDHPRGPQLLVKSQRLFMPLIILPIPEAYVDDVEDIVKERLPEEHLEEPFFEKLMEFAGF